MKFPGTNIMKNTSAHNWGTITATP